ncbi:hypothetical protein JQX13_13145 [Archangium violaceum]|uniref:DUF6328 family protein n=1 Tax=Archangium violaceum TaxID=83451 RepID=UPI00193C4D8A|nr:DUF6328 family protein [Archangium violaceum]QRK10928.1 hypothetical protein JQX13_13145 [Archangium violaceum]
MDSQSTERERFREILEELRTIIPGVQVLLAFLLTTPFSSRFDQLGQTGRTLYGVAVASAAIATILLLAPASYHRITRLSQERDVHRRRRIKYAGVMTVSGLLFLLVSIITAILLVTQFVFDMSWGMLVAGLVLVIALVCWYVVPLIQRPGHTNESRR